LRRITKKSVSKLLKEKEKKKDINNMYEILICNDHVYYKFI